MAKRKTAATVVANEPKTVVKNGPEIKSEIIDFNKLGIWLDMGSNILLRGKHGCGKTSIIMQICQERGYSIQYYSASTLDPWVDLIGIPRPAKFKMTTYDELLKKETEVERECISLVRPEHFERDNTDVIIFDELNRAPKKVRNAVMELIQFKSINGKRFHRLKNVIGIINPHDENETYDVEPMCPAQLDRFHIHYEVPCRPDRPYFHNKFGDYAGDIAINYWESLGKDLQEFVSPRRLDYAMEYYVAGHKDLINDILPMETNPSKLIEALGSRSIQDVLREIVARNNTEEIKKWINDPNNYDNSIQFIIENTNYGKVFFPQMSRERLANLLTTCKEVEDFFADNADVDNQETCPLCRILDEVATKQLATIGENK